ncbi:carbohydrate kinase family protein [Streptomyces sp. BI20]|uniref:carbohydrate kinase family protein n=1 Tax=Streptomyces sp. BI20 TaxID=3403460 RepID=UPI003C722C80
MTSEAGPGAAEAGGLLVIGDVITDVVARHAAPLARATDTSAAIRTLPGGAGANAACWAVHAGAPRVVLWARVGADSARWHARALREAGVRARLVVAAGERTGTVVALVGPDGERTFLTDSGAALGLTAADWSPGLLDGIGHLHLSGYLWFDERGAGAVGAALAAAVARGIPVSVDPASAGFLREWGAERFLAAVAGCSVLLPNADEALLLAGALAPGGAPVRDPARAAAELSRVVPLVVVTCGAEGAVVARAGRVVARVAGTRLPAGALVDSTGAGDAFTGGFLAARLAGADPVAAAGAGCGTAASAVTVVGGRPPVPDPAGPRRRGRTGCVRGPAAPSSARP